MNKIDNNIMKQALINCADVIHVYCKQVDCNPNECIFCEYTTEPFIECKLYRCPDAWRLKDDKES